MGGFRRCSLDWIGGGLVDGFLDRSNGHFPPLAGLLLVLSCLLGGAGIPLAVCLRELDRSAADVESSSGVTADSSHFAARKLDSVRIYNATRNAFQARLYDLHELLVAVAGKCDASES